MGIQLAGADVPLNRGVELPCFEGLVPRAKARQLVRGELFDGFLDVFGGGHVRDAQHSCWFPYGQPLQDYAFANRPTIPDCVAPGERGLLTRSARAERLR